MAQYIDKSALVAEIERRNEESWLGHYTKEKGIVFDITDDILSFINSLEVKDVDLEKELESWRHNHFHGRRDKDASGEYLKRYSQLDLAKHFFELGRAVGNKAWKGE